MMQRSHGPPRGQRQFPSGLGRALTAWLIAARTLSYRRAIKVVGLFTLSRAASAVAIATSLLLYATIPTDAASVRIVAIGASNTHGWYVGNRGAYPAKLQELLRDKGIDAQVANAGVPFETTAGMLNRIESDVPNDTDIVILQPGANDLRFFGTREQRAANIASMEQRLRNRSIQVIVYDDDIPLRYYALDFIHLTEEGHAMIAAALLPRVMTVIGRQPDAASPDKKSRQPLRR